MGRELRPRRTLVTEVRPPNNCFDVLVDIQPRAIGIVSRRDKEYQAVSEGGPEDWVATRVRERTKSKGPGLFHPIRLALARSRPALAARRRGKAMSAFGTLHRGAGAAVGELQFGITRRA